MGRFDDCLRKGKLGESAISRWLQSRGCMVMPAYDVELGNGKGPQLFCSDGDLVLPDLLTFNDGRTIWVEAKHKTCFSWYRKTQRWVTGIDLRHYHEYVAVAEKTALPVWLLFFHPHDVPDDRDLDHGCPARCPKGLFGGAIARLQKCESHKSERHGPSGMVYWAVDHLTLLASAAQLTEAA